MKEENPAEKKYYRVSEEEFEAFYKTIPFVRINGVTYTVVKDPKEVKPTTSSTPAAKTGGYYIDNISYLVERLSVFFSSGRIIKRAPGYRVLSAAEFLCSPKTMDQVFEPLVSDWQEEYFVALNEKRWFKVRWISIRYMWKALLAFGLSKVFAAVRAFSTKR